MQQVQHAIDKGYEYAFLIAETGSRIESDAQLQLLLNTIPKSAIVICSLPCMQAGSHEIVRAKELAAMPMPNANAHSNVDAAKIAAIVIQNACVGDAEDLKYTAFVVEGINKKSSKNFQMMGLTGTANGFWVRV